MILGIAYYYKSTESQRLDGPIVDTHYGKLKGIRSDSRQGRSFYEFLGIPYAAPPINELRFEVSFTRWKYKHQNILETNMDIMLYWVLKEKLITFSLNFQPPKPPAKWEGVRDASRYGSQCLQLEMLLGLILGDEDCLFLNVFVSCTFP